MGMSDEALMSRLNEHPELRSRVEAMLLIVEDELGNLREADAAFAQVMDKLVEHYGVLLPVSTIRHVTEFHAQRIFETTQIDESWPVESGCETVVAEMDGGMVPVVEVDTTQKDRRKGKKLHWKEAKLCLAHVAGSKTLWPMGEHCKET